MKKPFIDAKAAEISDESILSYSRIYLVDDSLDGDDPEKLIKKNFKVIFILSIIGGNIPNGDANIPNGDDKVKW